MDAGIGPNDAVLLAGPDGDIIYSKHADKPLTPASTLKLLTALFAFHHLGSDFRFQTEFFQDADGNIYIKGYGDPLLISEEIEWICSVLGPKIEKINNLFLDDLYFRQPIMIPGIKNSAEPYDAPNGALCVNFNTVFFRTVDGIAQSAEKQTPILPLAIAKIRKTRLKQGRIILSHSRNEILQYAGEMFQYFLKAHGTPVLGEIHPKGIDGRSAQKIFKHRSRHTLERVVAKLLEFSNNFIANQVLLTVGAEVHGPPAGLNKAAAAMHRYAADVLNMTTLEIVEGSGISRRNKISANDMLSVLKAFEPHHRLMRRNGNEWYKTGTLDGISTRAGYIQDDDTRLYKYVVFLNSSSGTNAELQVNHLIQWVINSKP
ncbi:MAG: D-alanyl-D-alanine carboxypeptidase [Desulfobacteraceae bacterium]|nr:D-alanyl-D-alanine carboxypeptidase [Desulfobacteraceae bacterium]